MTKPRDLVTGDGPWPMHDPAMPPGIESGVSYTVTSVSDDGFQLGVRKGDTWQCRTYYPETILVNCSVHGLAGLREVDAMNSVNLDDVVGDALRTMRDETVSTTERSKAVDWIIQNGFDTNPEIRSEMARVREDEFREWRAAKTAVDDHRYSSQYNQNPTPDLTDEQRIERDRLVYGTGFGYRCNGKLQWIDARDVLRFDDKTVTVSSTGGDPFYLSRKDVVIDRRGPSRSGWGESVLKTVFGNVLIPERIADNRRRIAALESELHRKAGPDAVARAKESAQTTCMTYEDALRQELETPMKTDDQRKNDKLRRALAHVMLTEVAGKVTANQVGCDAVEKLVARELHVHISMVTATLKSDPPGPRGNAVHVTAAGFGSTTWPEEVAGVKFEPAKLKPEHIVEIRSVHGDLILKCSDPEIDRSGTCGSLKFSSEVSSGAYEVMHRIASSRVPFQVSCGTNFDSVHALFDRIENPRGPSKLVFDIEIKALFKETAVQTKTITCRGDVHVLGYYGRGFCECGHYESPHSLTTEEGTIVKVVSDAEKMEAERKAGKANFRQLTTLFDPSKATGEALDRLAELTGSGGTRSSVRAALQGVLGVTYADVIDCSSCAAMKSGEVAVIVAGGEPGAIAMALYQSASCGLTWLGDLSMQLSSSSMNTEVRWHAPGSAPAHLLEAAIAQATGRNLEGLANAMADAAGERLGVEGLKLPRVFKSGLGETEEEFRARIKNPLSVEVDGVALGICLRQDHHQRNETVFAATDGTRGLTAAQRSVVSAYHSLQLRDRIAKANAEAKAREITVCVQVDAEDLPW